MGIDFFLEMGWWEFRIHIVFLWWGNLFPLSIYSSLLEVCFQYLLLDEALKSQTFAPFLQRPKGTIRNVLELVTKFERMKAKCVFLRTVWAVKRIPQHLRNINGCEGSIAQHENLTGYRAIWPLVTGSVNIKQPSSTDSRHNDTFPTHSPHRWMRPEIGQAIKDSQDLLCATGSCHLVSL